MDNQWPAAAQLQGQGQAVNLVPLNQQQINQLFVDIQSTNNVSILPLHCAPNDPSVRSGFNGYGAHRGSMHSVSGLSDVHCLI